MTYLTTVVMVFSIAMAIYLSIKPGTNKVDKISAIIAYIGLAIISGFMIYLEHMYYDI